MALGIDRMAIALQAQQTQLQIQKKKRLAVIPVKEEMKTEALKIAQMLREHCICVEFEVMGRKMGKALEDADKRKVDYAVIVGERELQQGKIMLKDFTTREQTEVEISKLAEVLS
jgi:histidyl-tRNA synthetase